MAKTAQERRDDLIAQKTKAVEVAEKKAKSKTAKLEKAKAAYDAARAAVAPLAVDVALAKAELEWAKSAPVAAPVAEDAETFNQADETDQDEADPAL